ncbi:putative esterase [[Synechococcus] sp. NIES-970]|uniref:S-formylglutathione hydrolase n=1 Tax=Picosynechococcus sp. NKBG15041c TaxID=1407650 RepID=UPI0004032639|nr:S-formylglutathione hydrolase [Picosynechococcus sp. NKBG15041c]BAW96250.1 putative esterase [[Synechococcus] sp. NIES-970]
MANLVLTKEIRCFGGKVQYYQHDSEVCGLPMNFAVFIPPQATEKPVPVLYYLSGLTCTEENFTAKAGAQQYAAELGLMLVAPDTSPRNTGIPDEDKDWDLGSGAGFYVDATQQPWAKHYQMYSYITEELPQLIEANFSVTDKRGIFGHSMGGHGALVCALRKPDFYQSVSAFAPIVAPSQCPWGEKAFTAYLGADQTLWEAYDTTALIQRHGPLSYPILVDQGSADGFLAEQLLTDKMAIACEKVGQPLTLRYQEGYDHSYFFIATFMEDHIRHHSQFLLA